LLAHSVRRRCGLKCRPLRVKGCARRPMDYANYDLSSVLLGLVAVLPLGLGALYVLARAEKRRMPKWSPWPKAGSLR